MELEKKTDQPNFWEEREKATKLMQELERKREEVAEFEKIEKEIKETEEFLNLLDSEKTEENTKKNEIENEIKEQVENLAQKMEQLETRTLLKGKYDQNDAIVNIYVGAGGIDAQDWAEMLLRMYLRWAERKKMKVKIIEKTKGNEAGIKSATLEIKGKYAYGYLKGEKGVHRLVRLSPFNTAHTRETSFARVEVLPVLPAEKEIKIKESDLRVDTFHSSGAGGQSVNTTDSAVRLTHLPTGLMVTCQNERSQRQNKETALKILQAKLFQLEREKRKNKEEALKGDFTKAEWGNQIRSYVLHPYKLVKDHRTKIESKQVEKVLDGEIDNFMEAYLGKK